MAINFIYYNYKIIQIIVNFLQLNFLNILIYKKQKKYYNKQFLKKFK